MIPKIIHYCWFGEAPIPERLTKCICSWKELLPDYEFVKWDENNFDIKSKLWTEQAYLSKKYAFVSDYVRLKALYDYGGIYLDTDVMVKKSFNDLLHLKAFTGFESEDKITSAIIGAEKHFPIIKEFMEFYNDRAFLLDSGETNKEANVIMMTEICEKHGLLRNNTYQIIEEMHIFPKTYFCPLDFWRNKDFTDNTYCIHYFEASWLDEETKKRITLERKQGYKIWSSVLRRISEFRHKLRGKN